MGIEDGIPTMTISDEWKEALGLPPSISAIITRDYNWSCDSQHSLKKLILLEI
jgi:hypothetical protein